MPPVRIPLVEKSRRRALAVVTIAAALGLGGCGGSHSSGPSGTTVAGGGPNGKAPASTATITGDLTGTGVLGLCTGGIGSLRIKVDGDPETYFGSISATAAAFVGPAGANFAARKAGRLPTLNATRTVFDVNDVTLTDAVTHRSVTLHGRLTCP